MSTNDFLPFGTSGSAPVLSQADWIAATPANGRGAGILPKEYFNKAIRQPAFVGAMIGSFMVAQGQDALDNANLAGFETAYEAALLQFMKSKFPQSGTTNGVLTLPGGVILQWGQVHVGNLPASPAWVTQTITFNEAFPAHCFYFGFTYIDINGNQVAVAQQASKLPTLVDSQVMLGEFNASTQDVYINWLAVGI